ncbi:MAG: OmpA family protein [Verrucomicrobiota bacterium]|jgi:peptidoglycan-associated lipoprotein
MKTTKLIYPLVLALVAVLATTGCKHKPAKVTPLPGQPAFVGNENNPTTLPSTPPINPNEGANQGPLPQASLETFEGMVKDSSALAAYTIHFAFDSSVIRSSEKPNLAQVASVLGSDPSTKLLIEGNCDERGTEEYNRSLGERRALAAREALTALGVDPSRIRTLSNGKDKPVNPGHDESAWSQNRNDQFILLRQPKTGV